MDGDLIAYLEKKIKALEAENQKLRKAIRNAGFQILQTSGDWSIHDVSELAKSDEARTNQVIAENIDLRIEIESLKKQLAAVPHWVPVAEVSPKEGKFNVVYGSRKAIVEGCDTFQCIYDCGKWFWSGWEVSPTHVLVGLNPPASNEDPRGDGDLLPENERLDELTRECMRDELAASANDIEAAMRRRLMEPFLGSEAETLGAKKYQLRDSEEWEYLSILNKWERASSAPHWYSNVQYRLAKGD